MLFMGSDRYPDENDYDAFLTAHGGSSNACTEEVRRCGRLRCGAIQAQRGLAQDRRKRG